MISFILDLNVLQFWKEHALADLIWNAKTREELRECLDAELRLCVQDRELSGKRIRFIRTNSMHPIVELIGEWIEMFR